MGGREHEGMQHGKREAVFFVISGVSESDDSSDTRQKQIEIE